MSGEDGSDRGGKGVADSLIGVTASFRASPEWRAGSIRGPSGTIRTVEADALAENMLVQAVLRVAADSKVVDELLKRTSAVLFKYLRSQAFEKRIQVHIEALVGSLLEQVGSSNEAVRDGIGAKVGNLYGERLEARWRERVEERVEADLDAALSEVRAKFGQGGGR